jgi:hypothetical protein
MRFAPVVSLLRLKSRECRDLRDALTIAQVRFLAAETGRLRAERERDQALRDSELVALMARDRGLALGFLRDQHTIDRLEEA